MKESTNFFLIAKVVLGFIGSISFVICVSVVTFSFLGHGQSADVPSKNHAPKQYMWSTQVDEGLKSFDHMPKWGSYRPGYYISLRSKVSFGSMTSTLMWSATSPGQGQQKYRHETNQDELKSFEWFKHNGRNFGTQRLLDRTYDVDILSHFIVSEHNNDKEALHSPTWFQKIDITGRSRKTTKAVSLMQYFAADCPDRDTQAHCFDLTKMNSIEILPITPADSSEPSGYHVVGYNKVNGWFLLSVFVPGDGSGALSHSGFVGVTGVDAYRGSRQLVEEITASSNPTKPTKKLFVDEVGELHGAVAEDSTFLALELQVSLTASDIYKPNITIYTVYSEHLPVQSITELKETYLAKENLLEQYQAQYAEYYQQYDEAFHSTMKEHFPLKENDPFHQNVNYQKYIRNALSSLLGGIGYFEGKSRVGINVNTIWDTISSAPSTQQLPLHTFESGTNPYFRLISATPSRTSFPRGFMWDEGFHQLVIQHFNKQVTFSVIASWLQSMFLSPMDIPKTQKKRYLGWIPREMILGDDSTARVPDEFVTQRMNTANPPTFLLVLESLIQRFVHPCIVSTVNSKAADCEESEVVIAFLRNIYPRLSYWIEWFHHSQLAEATSEHTEKTAHPAGYRWKGRSEEDQRKKLLMNTLSSGLDDYPRAMFLSSTEQHVDLYVWMMKAYHILAEIEEVTKPTKSGAQGKSEYTTRYLDLLASLDSLHWASLNNTQENGGYFDTGLDLPPIDPVTGQANNLTYRVEVHFRCSDPNTNTYVDDYYPLTVVQRGLPFCPQSHPRPMYPLGGDDQYRERIVPPPAASLRHTIIPRIGYVTIFPFLLQVLPPNAPTLPRMLSILRDETLLWSPYGLRSLATTDPFYWKPNAPGDNPYWR
jgi:mannosyl-oligosaccharide glucosidase